MSELYESSHRPEVKGECTHTCPYCRQTYSHTMDEIYGCPFMKFRNCGCLDHQYGLYQDMDWSDFIGVKG